MNGGNICWLLFYGTAIVTLFSFYNFNDAKLYILNAPQLVLKVELFFVTSSSVNIVRIKQGYFVISRINQVHLNFS